MRERLLSALDLYDLELGVVPGWTIDVTVNGDLKRSKDPEDLLPDEVRYLTIRLFEFSEYKGLPIRLKVNLDLELIAVAHC
jgi:hypothetical protein